MKFILLALLCVSVCYCYYGGESKGYPQQDMNDQQIVQIPTIPPPKRKCTGPPEVGVKGGGRCRASMRRYYYDESKGKCVKFIYGGCGATQNNFETKEECQRTCMKHRRSTPKYNYPNYPKYPTTPNYYFSTNTN
ncbi:Kunitz/Bovine pancreatic trypsin inhibitor domain protein [Ancylostoma duodenale]|uniref:Kunitz/Bovine pancreatic trypsin inhibitor domain protein n=1 Tax=Ancylostoma duodenale TaxID=51022 RepID=A0A0C2GWW0_9BILA|nr:Kunitz/Bovine pancreatic trypsin inhibitor domain protein [Ancylostoma duodenale]